MGLTFRGECAIICIGTNARHLSESARVPVGLPALRKGNGGGGFLRCTGKRKSFSFPDALQGGGDVLMYVTWYELVEFIMALITLAFVIMSYVNSKKR